MTSRPVEPGLCFCAERGTDVSLNRHRINRTCVCACLISSSFWAHRVSDSLHLCAEEGLLHGPSWGSVAPYRAQNLEYKMSCFFPAPGWLHARVRCVPETVCVCVCVCHNVPTTSPPSQRAAAVLLRSPYDLKKISWSSWLKKWRMLRFKWCFLFFFCPYLKPLWLSYSLSHPI